MRLFQPLEIFFRNLRDSFRYSLKGIYNKTQDMRLSDDMLLEHILYAIPNSGIKRPTILSGEETLNEILTTNKNIARFGDGEIMIMNGEDITFQKADKTLAMRLKEIFTNPHPNLMIGINRRYYYPNPRLEIMEQTNEICKNFELYVVPRMRKILTKYINYDIKYCEASTGKMVGGESLPNVAAIFPRQKACFSRC